MHYEGRREKKGKIKLEKSPRTCGIRRVSEEKRNQAKPAEPRSWTGTRTTLRQTCSRVCNRTKNPTWGYKKGDVLVGVSKKKTKERKDYFRR